VATTSVSSRMVNAPVIMLRPASGRSQWRDCVDAPRAHLSSIRFASPAGKDRPRS
jgi:hypothetical protein